ncbi:cytochrome b [Nocardioides panzhihuensis]|uniref:Cytochrome b561 n=1 Tax=Nocardioides panzhihuensis TaxID=860243 RepID=A0A7Z0DKS5_9ACTN|nr:cytochrome b/b6 domain-containing protein [Nocardioides panzhihuensis]NYI77441.1 cytochrome b561 [Nocardioides panzhihuensis]
MSGARATGYGVVAKTLHWLTVAAFVLQFAVGYIMSTETDCDPPGEDRGGGDASEVEEERFDRLEEACEAREADPLAAAWGDLWGGGIRVDAISLPELHILLGLAILLLGGLRVAWRMIAPLPPWDPRLTARDRRTAHVTERVLIALMFLVPLTGIALVAVSDGLVALHVAAHIAFFVALGAHVLLMLSRGLLPRMLPGTAYVSKDRG